MKLKQRNINKILKCGENWRNASICGNYTEHYVELADGPLPVGVIVVRELREQGASIAGCTHNLE